MTSTHINPATLGRGDCGLAVLRTADLQAWCESKSLHLPIGTSAEFVGVETILLEVEQQANRLKLSDQQAVALVLAHPALRADPAVARHLPDVDPTICRWLIGANAAGQWRRLIAAAIAAGELRLLDPGSLLPLAGAVQQAPVHQTEVQAGVAQIRWTPDRIAQARAMQADLRSKGVADHASQTAAAFGVTPQRLRAVLADKSKAATPKGRKKATPFGGLGGR